MRTRQSTALLFGTVILAAAVSNAAASPLLRSDPALSRAFAADHAVLVHHKPGHAMKSRGHGHHYGWYRGRHRGWYR